MATGFFDTYASTGIREDVRDLVTVISPEESPVFSLLRQGECINTRHEWLTISLPTASGNKTVEGTAWAYDSATAETRLQNYTQIFTKTWRVSGTIDAVSKYGRGREWEFRRGLAMKAIKLDIEEVLLENTASAAGASTATARTLKGLPGAAQDGGQTATANSSSSLRTPIDEIMLNQALYNQWLQGVRPDYLIVNGFVKRAIAGFVGISAGRPIESRNGERVASNIIDVYESDFGRLNIVMTRNMPNMGSQVLSIHNEFLTVCWLRPPTSETPPKDGDYFPGVLYAEGTLEYLNPNAVLQLTRVQSA